MAPWVQIGTKRMEAPTIDVRVKQAAAGFKSLGIGANDVVAICMRNDFFLLEAALGAAYIGAYVTPINWHSSAQEMTYVLENSRAKALVIHSDLFTRLSAAIPATTTTFVCSPSPDLVADYTLEIGQSRVAEQDWSLWLEQFAPYQAPPEPPLGSMIYTSGTTGRPTPCGGNGQLLSKSSRRMNATCKRTVQTVA